jgi:hypothetical protein
VGLKNKITQISFEVANQVVANVVGNLNNNSSSLATISAISTDSTGNTVCTVTANGNTYSNVYLATNRPLGIGDTISLVGAQGSYIAQ